MDKISLVRLILVTLPENICNIYIAFLLTGYRLRLPFRDNKSKRKGNIIKLLITICLFSAIQYFGRRIFTDMGTYLLISFILYITILRIIYGKKYRLHISIFFLSNTVRYFKEWKVYIVKFLNEWKIPLLQVLITIIFLSTIEGIYIPPVLQIFNISIKDAFLPEHYLLNLLLPQLDRFFQVLIITMLWNYERAIQNIINYKCKKSLFIQIFVYIIVLEFSLAYLYIISFTSLPINLRIVFFIICLMANFLNIRFFKMFLNLVDNINLRHKNKRKGDKEQ